MVGHLGVHRGRPTRGVTRESISTIARVGRAQLGRVAAPVARPDPENILKLDYDHHRATPAIGTRWRIEGREDISVAGDDVQRVMLDRPFSDPRLMQTIESALWKMRMPQKRS